MLSLLFCVLLAFSVYAGVNDKLEDKYTMYIHVLTIIVGIINLISIIRGY